VATYSLHRFSRPDTLKKITPRYLLEFLSPYREFFTGRGVQLPSVSAPDRFDYPALVGVFMNPEPDAPQELLEALFFVDEMANPTSMDALLEEAERLAIRLDGGADLTPADVAVQVWLRNRDILERKHAEQSTTRPRTFEYFSKNGTQQLSLFKPPSRPETRQLESELDEWFERKRRGRGCRVFDFPRAKEVWFLVRHGEPYRREGAIEDGKSTSVYYRPERYDVVVYSTETAELRVHAGTKGEKELYRQKFGEHLFGNKDFFLGEAKYTLEPLRRDGVRALVCADVEGMDWVKLIEVHIFWGGAYSHLEIRKAEDVFAALKAEGGRMPRKPGIVRAKFLVKFTDMKRPRTVTIRAGNIAQYTRDDDSVAVEEWLVRRGFIVKEGDQKRGRAGAVMGGT